jgi:hypothetical protein
MFSDIENIHVPTCISSGLAYSIIAARHDGGGRAEKGANNQLKRPSPNTDKAGEEPLFRTLLPRDLQKLNICSKYSEQVYGIFIV